MSNSNLWLKQAKYYDEELGWAVMPVIGKEPVLKWKSFQMVRPTPHQRGGMFGRKGVTGIAVILGQVSGGLVCRDFDEEGAYERWAQEHPDLAMSLPTCRTRRGAHVLFRGKIDDKKTYLEDGEVLAESYYALLPPSVHPEDGSVYEWIVEPTAPIPLVDDPLGAGLLEEAPEAKQVGELRIEVLDAIAKTLPTRHGQRHNQIFLFARRLKAIEGLDTTPDALGRYIREWHRQAKPLIKTKDLLATESDFADAWHNAEVPLSDGWILALARQALAKPHPAWFTTFYVAPVGYRLLQVCIALCEQSANGIFFLGARKAGELVGVSPTDANKLMQQLTRMGYLQCVKKGSLARAEASEWTLGPQSLMEMEGKGICA